MLTKSTPVVMATIVLIIVQSLVLSVEGGWERLRSDGVGKLEMGNPPDPVPPSLCLSLLHTPCPCPKHSGPLGNTLQPRVGIPSPGSLL